MANLKKFLIPAAVLMAGAGIGGGTAAATKIIMGGGEKARPKSEESGFVQVKDVVAPLAFSDGRLAGYVSFVISLEVPKSHVEDIDKRVPLLLHAINMRTYKVPLASGPDGLLPNLDQFRAVVDASAIEAFGKGEVRRVAITQALPAN